MTKYCGPGDIKCKEKKKNPEYTFYKISKKLETGHDKLDLKLINLPASTVASKKKKKKKRCL